MIGEIIEHKRKERGLSRSKLARALDVSESYVTQMERADKIPGTKTLCKMADFFGCSVDELLDRKSAANA